MLQDSAHIQESDAEWKNRKAERSGAPRVEPLYTIEDAQRVQPVHDHLRVRPAPRPVRGRPGGVRGRGPSAGLRLHHSCTATEGGVTKQIVFSGDIGNVDQPIIRDPTYLDRRGLRGDGVHLRRPEPHGGVELHRRSGEDHRRDHRQGRQRGDPLLRRGPHPGAAVLHPGDQGRGDGEERPGLPGVHRLPPGQEGHHHLHRRPAGLSGRGGPGAGAGRHPHVQLHQPAH